MSFLLRHNGKDGRANTLSTHTMQRSFNPHGSLLSRSSAGMRNSGSGQSQAQIYRKVEKEIVASTQNKQKPQIQGRISMAEVLADLRILEEQQDESLQKLQTARNLKQRRLQQQGGLESKVDKLKYQNGQKHAELQHFHSLLSQGQRMLSTIRSSSEKSGEDLRTFDRALKIALVTKRTILARQRKQSRMLDEIRNKIGEVDSLTHDEESRFDDEAKNFRLTTEREQHLRRMIHETGEKLEVIAARTAKVRKDAFVLESDQDFLTQHESELTKLYEQKAEDAKSDDDKFQLELQDLVLQGENIQRKVKGLEETRTSIFEKMEKSTEELHQLWETILEIQKLEGHSINTTSNDQINRPELDIVLIKQSLYIESKAVEDEKKAKEDLFHSVSAFKSQLIQKKGEHAKLIEKSRELVNFVEVTRKIEGERSEIHADFLCKLDEVKALVDSKHSSLLGCRMKMENERSQLDKCLQDASYEHETQKTILERENKLLSILISEINALNTTNDKAKAKNSSRIDTANSLLSVQEERRKQLQREKTENTDDDPIGSYNREKMMEKYRTEITMLLEENPLLGDVRIMFDPVISPSEQASRDLSDIADNCRKRIDSARKVRAALREKTKNEKKERSAMRNAKIEEENEREEAILRRRMRIESETSGKAASATHKQSHREKIHSEDISAAKPRILLESFVRVESELDVAKPQATSNHKRTLNATIVETIDKKVHFEEEEEDIASESNVIEDPIVRSYSGQHECDRSKTQKESNFSDVLLLVDKLESTEQIQEEQVLGEGTDQVRQNKKYRSKNIEESVMLRIQKMRSKRQSRNASTDHQSKSKEHNILLEPNHLVEKGKVSQAQELEVHRIHSGSKEDSLSSKYHDRHRISQFNSGIDEKNLECGKTNLSNNSKNRVRPNRQSRNTLTDYQSKSKAHTNILLEPNHLVEKGNVSPTNELEVHQIHSVSKEGSFSSKHHDRSRLSQFKSGIDEKNLERGKLRVIDSKSESLKKKQRTMSKVIKLVNQSQAKQIDGCQNQSRSRNSDIAERVCAVGTENYIKGRTNADPVQCREVGGIEMTKKVEVPNHSRRKSDSELLGAGHKRSLDERLHQARHQRRKRVTNFSQTNSHNRSEQNMEGSLLPVSCKEVQHGWKKQKSSTKRSMLASFGEDGAYSFL